MSNLRPFEKDETAFVLLDMCTTSLCLHQVAGPFVTA